MPEVTSLSLLGWSEAFAAHMPPGASLRPARVASVYAARVDVWTEDGPHLASLRSRARTEALGGVAVGDWVAVGGMGDGEVVVEAVLPRRTAFLRQAAGERTEPQAIAANVDRVFVVTSADADFNLRRLERYVVAIAAGGAEAAIVFAKADLGGYEERRAEASALAPSFVTSARSGEGIDALLSRIPAGSTVALVGSSGVGKSALVNRLLGADAQREGAVRAYDGRGRHTTTRRALFAIPGAGLLIDTPGMRELRPWLPEGGGDVDDAFDDIGALAATCRYRDCAHAREPGCAVAAALASGALAAERFAAWQKLAREGDALEVKRRARVATVALRKRPREA